MAKDPESEAEAHTGKEEEDADRGEGTEIS